MNNDMKYIRKAAFAAGFGLVMGKFVGDCVIAVFDGAAAAINERRGKPIDASAKDVCGDEKRFK